MKRLTVRCFFLITFLTVLVAPSATRAVSAQGIQNPQYLPLVANIYPLILQNQGFESGRKAWTETSQPAGVAIILHQNDSRNPPPAPPHGGQWLAWLGGKENLTQSISQQTYISDSAPYLTYWQWIASLDECGRDKVTISVDGAAAYTYDLCKDTETPGWQLASFDLSAHIGKTVTIAITATNNATNNSNLFIDDVLFQAAP